MSSVQIQFPKAGQEVLPSQKTKPKTSQQDQVTIQSHHHDFSFPRSCCQVTILLFYSLKVFTFLPFYSLDNFFPHLSTVCYLNLISPAQLKNLQINLNQ